MKSSAVQQEKGPEPIRAQRELRLWERQGSWIFIGIILAILCVAVGIEKELRALLQEGELSIESLSERLSSLSLRGFRTGGLILGALSVLFTLLSFLYSWKRRTTGESSGSYSLTAWLWSHIYLGLLALWAGLLHAGHALLSRTLNTGFALLALLALIAASGLLWRLVYFFLPRRVLAKVGSYSQENSLEQARENQIEIEKLCAGGSKALQQLKELMLVSSFVKYQLIHLARFKQITSTLEGNERERVKPLEALARARRGALWRMRRQGFYSVFVKIWRLLHIPLVLLLPILLLFHLGEVSTAYYSRNKAIEKEGFASAASCQSCHQEIYAQWKDSMHAHALTSPVTVLQTNLVVETKLVGKIEKGTFGGKELLCNNCHGPVGVLLTNREVKTLPIEDPKNPSRKELLNEGITCVVCHQYSGQPSSGGAGSDEFQKDLYLGDALFGYQHNAVLVDLDTICQNCHNVNAKKKDGSFLELQNTYKEYDLYKKSEEFTKHQEKGEPATCTECHMKIDPKTEKKVRDHSFVGVDYPLDKSGQDDPHREKREALLQSAATIEISNVSFDEKKVLSFDVTITNTGAGHNLPSGFAFARQMWLEVQVTDKKGKPLKFQNGSTKTLARSGFLDKENTDDLCDQETIEGPLRAFMQGCESPDIRLVSYQKKLRDDKKEETVLQHLDGSVVTRTPRKLGGDDTPIDSIEPGKKQKFSYTFRGLETPTKEGGQIEVKLKFRNLPPYFLRALIDQGEKLDVFGATAIKVENLQTVTMETAIAPFSSLTIKATESINTPKKKP